MNNGGLENVFVYVKDGLGNYYFDTPTTAGHARSEGLPLLAARLRRADGQPLEIVNSDPTLHNVHAMAKANQEFNLAQAHPGHEEHEDVHGAGGHGALQVRRARLDERLRRRR